MVLSHVTLKPEISTTELYYIMKKNHGNYASHQMIWLLFENSPEDKRDFLFRQINQNQFLVLSQRKPSYSQKLFMVESKLFEPCITEGMQLHFLLRTNPAVTETDAKGKKKKIDVMTKAARQFSGRSDRQGEKTEAMKSAALEWLKQRASDRGFRVLEAECSHVDYDEFLKPENSKNFRKHHRIQMGVADFEGALEVVNTELFEKCLKEGMGRGKSMGCGLMLIRRT